ncbi:uncharacterized protein EV420DRAFT_1652703 [Desarmillaria tabescens]|uniref:Uncharacterized protein n=1 Tax=Armillaria tabescens TaxID=1929756 RepID=A0AA39J765_ARMTA|nr:uncharacterized protein EV420DRAFT_1652703 [Desarmillaria tabescens]KAK0436074.1 hypothetical protein EV420DRAFT_1652703 [Desarmillaria tabescens]
MASPSISPAKVGRTDGEAPEHGWAATNALAASTKEMGPGTHRDTLDDHFGDYNWRKVIILADTLCARLKEAVKARLEHVEEFIGYEDALQAEHSESVHSWRQIVLSWENIAVTENAVHLELAREEKNISAVEIRHDVSPSELIAQGLQLEEAQVRLQCDINALGSHSTDLQHTKVQAQDNQTTLLRTRDEDLPCHWNNCIRLQRFPSISLPQHSGSMLLILTTQNTIVADEWRLRLAQANDTLAALCQCYGTKANTLFHQVEGKIAADVARYQRIYTALSSMSVKLNRFEWQGILHPLKNEDVRGLDQYNELTSEGHRNLAWIWKTNLQEGDKGLQEGKRLLSQHPLQIEWCKSWARAQRWQEECDLLTEELHRVQVTFAYYAQRWTKRVEFSSLPGARAYAFRQVALWSELHADAEAKWLDVQTSLDLNSSKHSIATTDLDNRTINQVDNV